MICSASGTYSLPSARMKSYWVSTSQKMTRGMPGSLPQDSVGNLSEDVGTCQQEGGKGQGYRPVLQPQHHRNLITTVLARTPGAIRPHLEREVLLLGQDETELEEERRLARQRQHFGDPVGARFRDERLRQRPAHAAALVARGHGEPRDLRQRERVDLQRAAPHDAATGLLGHDVFLDVPAQVVVAAGQQVAGRDVGRHERLEGRDVGQGGRAHLTEQGAGSSTFRGDVKVRLATEGTAPGALLPQDRQRAHASTASSTTVPRSSSSGVMTSGGTSRSTFVPAVRISSPRSRAAVTNGAAGSVSSRPHISPRPRASRTRGRRAARAASRAPSHSPLLRTWARKSGSAMVCTTASATLETSGPPPNVVAWSPGLRAVAIASRRSTAPIGSPPASGLASVRRSGTMPVCSYANRVPVRPSPHCTSSKMMATPRESHSSRRNPSHSGSTGRTPPSPCTGSTITAAVRDADTA